VMVVLEEALSGFAIRKPPNDCERLKSPSMASRPRRMWLRPSPFRDPGPTARPRLELGGAAVRSIAGFSGVTTILDLGNRKRELFGYDTHWLDGNQLFWRKSQRSAVGYLRSS
jgi:hypothetical protein